LKQHELAVLSYPAPGDMHVADSIGKVIVPAPAISAASRFAVHCLPGLGKWSARLFSSTRWACRVQCLGQGIDVRPDPYVNLATVAYLFDGEIIHRDSLGTMMPIRPSAVNWMTAGRLFVGGGQRHSGLQPEQS
jgi:hypothetical protein